MRIAVLSSTLLALVAGCQGEDTAREAHAERGHDVQWSYSGDTGPEHWGELDPDFAAASTGRRQSPIDISGAGFSEPQEIEFHYEVTSAVMVNNGHTIEVDFETGPYFVIDESRFDLIQFHFHSPSEHTIDGEHADMEVHFVHENDRGEPAVVAVMYVEGEHNAALDPFWEKFPKKPGDRVVMPDAFARADQTLPTSDRHYRYEGSLTTPPCTEGVTWIVMQESVEISREQIEWFRKFYVGNNRPVQPLYGREVLSE